MTKTEAALLAYLARNAGHVCTRALLLREVWGWENAAATLTRTVDTHVCMLRKHLPDGATIVTLRGLGYRYLAPGSARA
jgi:DNA-binding response OmpR family regulator